MPVKDQMNDYNCEVVNRFAIVDGDLDMDPTELIRLAEERTLKEKEEKRKQKEKEKRDKRNKMMNPPRKEQKKGVCNFHFLK